MGEPRILLRAYWMANDIIHLVYIHIYICVCVQTMTDSGRVARQHHSTTHDMHIDSLELCTCRARRGRIGTGDKSDGEAEAAADENGAALAACLVFTTSFKVQAVKIV